MPHRSRKSDVKLGMARHSLPRHSAPLCLQWQSQIPATVRATEAIFQVPRSRSCHHLVSICRGWGAEASAMGNSSCAVRPCS